MNRFCAAKVHVDLPFPEFSILPFDDNVVLIFALYSIAYHCIAFNVNWHSFPHIASADGDSDMILPTNKREMERGGEGSDDIKKHI